MDPTSISIGVGLAVSILLTELFGLAAGGMVTPGYLALHLDQPLIVANTLLAATLTWLIVRGLSHWIIVYGRRRTALMILVGFLVGFLMRVLGEAVAARSFAGPGPGELAVIGYIIPGLIAIWFERQGFLQTNAVVLTSSAMVRLLLVAAGMEMVT